MKPFLKWPGNKYAIRQHIIGTLPAGKRLIEPFAGSAAIFLNTHYSQYLLAESNCDLINLYKILQKKGVRFIEYCRSFFKPQNNCAEIYYQFREQFNRTRNLQLRSALFLYLNKHGYNGLCRYNSSGGYNVPFGSINKPYFPAQEMLHFHEKSQHADFIYSDFQDTLRQARTGDIVYCDPPYAPLSSTANFTAYTPHTFNAAQHIILAKLAYQISRRGITVIISNHDTPFTREHYANTQIYSFDVQRTISCQGNTRKKVPELIAVFHGE